MTTCKVDEMQIDDLVHHFAQITDHLRAIQRLTGHLRDKVPTDAVVRPRVALRMIREIIIRSGRKDDGLLALIEREVEAGLREITS